VRIPFSDGPDMDIYLAAVPAVRAGDRVARRRGVRMRRLLVGVVLVALVVVAIGGAR
jgi:hypothetical protein